MRISKYVKLIYLILFLFLFLPIALFAVMQSHSLQQHAAGTQDLTPSVIALSSPEIVNPMRGLYKWGGQEIAPVQSYDSYERFNWQQLEPTQGNYDFSKIDADLADAQSRGGKFGFRVRALWIGQGAQVPQYISTSSTSKGFWFNSAINGNFNCQPTAIYPQGNTGCDTFVPDFNDPFFISRTQTLFQALATRYKNDNRLSYIDVGMYGSYGEWHLSGLPSNPPNGWIPGTFANQQQIVDAQVNAFNIPSFTKIFLMPGGSSQIDSYFLQKSPKYGLRKDDLAATDMDNWPNLNDWLAQPYSGMSVNLSNTNPVSSGSNSIALTTAQSFSGLVFRWSDSNSTFDLTPYSTIHFALRAGQANSKISLLFVCAGTPACPKVTISPNPSSTTWSVYDLSLSSFFTAGRQITGIQFQDEANAGTTPLTYYLDEVAFVPAGNTQAYFIYNDRIAGAFNDYIVNRWKTAPLVSEFYAEAYPPTGVQDLARADTQVKTYHSSMISNGNYYNNVNPTSEWADLTPTEQSQFMQLSKDSGYRLVVNNVTAPVQITPGVNFTISSQWSNIGVAPLYEPWNVMWQLRDPITSAIIWQSQSSLNLQSFLPTNGTPQLITDTYQVPANFVAKTYTLSLQIVDSTNYRRPLAIAAQGQLSDGSYPLGSIVVPQPSSTAIPTPTNTPTVTPQPTQTPAPTQTPIPNFSTISLIIKPHGIGNSGDSVNGIGGNMIPLHIQRNIQVTLFDINNVQVPGTPVSGTQMTYDNNPLGTGDPAAKEYTLTLSLPPSITSGTYTFRVYVPGFLSSYYTGVVNLSVGTTSTVLPPISLITGDINGDNILDIRDYNQLLSDFGKTIPISNTLPTSDINDDGVVNIVDFNLMLREFSTQRGT